MIGCSTLQLCWTLRLPKRAHSTVVYSSGSLDIFQRLSKGPVKDSVEPFGPGVGCLPCRGKSGARLSESGMASNFIDLSCFSTPSGTRCHHSHFVSTGSSRSRSAFEPKITIVILAMVDTAAAAGYCEHSLGRHSLQHPTKSLRISAHLLVWNR